MLYQTCFINHSRLKVLTGKTDYCQHYRLTRVYQYKFGKRYFVSVFACQANLMNALITCLSIIIRNWIEADYFDMRMTLCLLHSLLVKVINQFYSFNH